MKRFLMLILTFATLGCRTESRLFFVKDKKMYYKSGVYVKSGGFFDFCGCGWEIRLRYRDKHQRRTYFIHTPWAELNYQGYYKLVKTKKEVERQVYHIVYKDTINNTHDTLWQSSRLEPIDVIDSLLFFQILPKAFKKPNSSYYYVYENHVLNKKLLGFKLIPSPTKK